jgi:hypothetical protein
VVSIYNTYVITEKTYVFYLRISNKYGSITALKYRAKKILKGELDGPGQCPLRAISETKQRSQWSVIGWVNKIYCLEILRA